jgi:two-component system chemotaxis sensor kinase CheA
VLAEYSSGARIRVREAFRIAVFRGLYSRNGTVKGYQPAMLKPGRSAGPVEDLAMNDLDLIVREFLVESHENLDKIDGDLLALEKDPSNRDRLSSVFRTIHTIKGTCGFFEFTKLGAVTHVGENLLSKLRSGELLLGSAITNGLLALVDAVRTILRHIEATTKEGPEEYAPLIARLTLLCEGAPAAGVVVAAKPVDAPIDAPAALNEAAWRYAC